MQIPRLRQRARGDRENGSARDDTRRAESSFWQSEGVKKAAGGEAMFVSEAREVDADGNAIGDAPSAADHDSVGVMRSAQD